MTVEQREEAVVATEVPAHQPHPNGDPGIQESEEVQPAPRTVLREYFESLVVTAIMAIFGMTFIVQAVKVPTGSMQNTILIGDHLLVNKFIFAPGPVVPFLPQREIRRGDVIVFKYPGKYQGETRFRNSPHVNDTLPNNLPFKTNYVKRVIGLPREHVELRGTQLFINGELLEENAVAALNPPSEDDGDPMNGDDKGAPLRDENNVPLIGVNAPPGEGPYTVYWDPGTLTGDQTDLQGYSVFDVPADHYLVLGDNRENSQDGRYWGYVPRELIIGRAMFVYWSYDESQPRSQIVFPLNYLADFVTNTRWTRTGTLIR